MENAETRCIIKLAQKTQQQTVKLNTSDSFNSFKSQLVINNKSAFIFNQLKLLVLFLESY